MALQDTEIRDRHIQALKEAKEACRVLGDQLDPDKMEPRGRQYSTLRAALKSLEGCCRQMHYMREDARWLKLGVIYARVLRAIQRKFVGQDWKWFKDLQPLFELGLRRLDELEQMKTGRLGPILPERPADFLVMPEQKLLLPGQDFVLPPDARIH